MVLIDFIKDNILYILAIVAFIFLSLVLFSLFNIQVIDNNKNNKDVSKVVTIEGFKHDSKSDSKSKSEKGHTDSESNTNKNKVNDKHLVKDKEFHNAFCKVHEIDHEKLEEQCNKLDKGSCNMTRCCVWVNENNNKNICSAGDNFGPIYLGTEKKPKTINYYYYKNKCIEKQGKCPK